ncbi:MAG: acetate--CoA ligase family protein [Xanthobacteraceae bacterium]|nr:acetate--CoA ligase family protein [Xanthobacteraceae bacterium]
MTARPAPRATTHPLDTLFSPESIAVIGASPEPLKIPGLLLAFLRKNGFAGAILPVNPRYDEIDGLRCYPSIAAVGRPVDLAIVVIPARLVLGMLEDCAAAGVRNAVVISSGFAEGGSDSADLQGAITALARRTGMRISGPNAEGFYNEPRRIAATFSPTVDVRPEAPRLIATPRRLGIVAQSGGIGFAIYNRAKAMGVAVSHVISTGNEADLAAGEVLGYLVQDAATDVVLLFIEGVRDPDNFVAALRAAAEAGKPVIVCKVGRTSAGERAAASHTASMAGWNAAYDAVFAAHGVIAVQDIDEAVAVAAAFASNPRPKGERVAVVTVSGGAGAWMADTLAGEGLSLPELSPALQAEIRALIPSYGSARNPVDITAQAVHTGGLQKIVEMLVRSDEVDLIAVVVSLSSETRLPLKPEEIGPVVARQAKPILVHTYTLPSQFSRDRLGGAGIVVHAGLAAVGKAAGALVRRAAFVPTPEGAAAAPLVTIPPSGAATGALSEHGSKQLLRAAGIAVPDEVLLRDRVELDAAVARIAFPWAMKIQSPQIPHKSEAGGVAINIADRDAALAAYDLLIANARRHRPDAALEGVLVGPMAKRGVEIIIGTLRDATFGPMVMVGLGGVATELFRDVVYRPAPVGRAEAAAMLASLVSALLLDGFRGSPKADVDALATLVAQVSQLAAGLAASVAEIEINPAIVHPAGQGVTIVDALVVGAPA